jgi:uncharacterized membrane protein YfcA
MVHPFLVAAALGFKHALDPDHVAATLNMTLSGKVRGWSALKIGASWGVGHATSMVALGLPVILFAASLPAWIYTSAELGVGLIIVALGLQLFIQWFKGDFHPHEVVRIRESHSHHHKSHKKAGLIGMLHGVGGSYPAALLMLASFSTTLSAAIGLAVFVALSIASMSLTTLAFSYAAMHHTMVHLLDRLVLPTIVVLTIVFGASYIQEALRALGIT